MAGIAAIISPSALCPAWGRVFFISFFFKKFSSPSIRPFALLGGVVFFTAAALQQVGIVTATVTNTSFLTALYVVVTPFLLWLLRHERPGPRVWLASGLAFIGIWALGGGAIGFLIIVSCFCFFVVFLF